MPKNFNNYNDKFAHDQNIQGVIQVTIDEQPSLITQGIDLLLLILTCDTSKHNRTLYYIKGDIRIQEKWFLVSDFERLTAEGKDSEVSGWLIRGEIVVERDRQLTSLRNNIVNNPIDMKERRLLNEFVYFLKKYQESRAYLLEEQVLDAYTCILQALNHWAKIAIIEADDYPESAIWKQVRSINPGIYKLFEELTMSNETLKQRVQLVLLACEFSVVSRTSRCCTPLLRILGSRQEPQSLEELRDYPELANIYRELPMLLNKLISKSLVKEVLVTDTNDASTLVVKYRIESK
ncbi:nucleotidyltransferase-like protein [Paenibacillus sp. N1-5-1-14]|uniref:nucleotidyltransferase-like protein n=1 Tax=Paenibacillus radicibacter TaxID=2972488 RepID=UPI002158D593|nr:nucleotidyltransferase-like protein [Paenibacillus radicibacter]MCR8644751.1 nucleotidyltransferase-like protein [Paenibacillus radicibacter]